MARQFGKRQVKSWASIAGQVDAFTANATVGGAGLAFTEASTILRMIGEYMIAPTTAPTIADQCTLTVGIAVVSADAFAAGGASLPDPSGSPEFPWLFWKSHIFRALAGTLDPGDQLPVSVRAEFDIRSMRKVKGREALAVVVEYTDINGTPPLKMVQPFIRVLLAT